MIVGAKSEMQRAEEGRISSGNGGSRQTADFYEGLPFHITSENIAFIRIITL